MLQIQRKLTSENLLEVATKKNKKKPKKKQILLSLLNDVGQIVTQ